jgi:predicted DCC family thiol-disulfide oxidoreductase YuxK
MRQHSYRDDASVPRFDDTRPIVVFDGVCVLCSGWMDFLVHRDPEAARFRFIVAQSPLGQALYRHYRLDPVEFETNLVLVEGRLHTKLDAFVAVMRALPGAWPLLSVARWLPRPIADFLYDRIAKNRYRWFGRRGTCLMPTPDLRARFLPDGWIPAPSS